MVEKQNISVFIHIILSLSLRKHYFIVCYSGRETTSLEIDGDPLSYMFNVHFNLIILNTQFCP